jgi:predicted nucleic acid-binding protein
VVEARALVDDLDLVPLDRGVQDLACDVGVPWLRTLDALHLASALLLGEALTALVTHDERILEAARDAGLAVSAPGRL